MTSLLDSLAEELATSSRAKPIARRSVQLLLGSDREIGRDNRSIECRVGVVPEQISRLKGVFKNLGVDLRVMVLRGAGERAGYSDADYITHGSEIVTEDQLAFLDGPPDVVHALKEPSRYEALVPGPFCRIGALHTGDFSSTSGLGRLLETPAFAIFDGSNIGAPGSGRIPIRGSMSIFAGDIAAQWVLEQARHWGLDGAFVVVGAGNAGKAATRRFLTHSAGAATVVHLFDESSGRLELAERELADSRVEYHPLDGRDAPQLLAALDGSAGLVLGVARPGGRAPRVLHLDSLRRLAEHALVVDVSIDERGAIHDPNAPSGWTAHELIPHLTRRVQDLGRDYRAQSNMPRNNPGPASRAHGEAVLPYLVALLHRAARAGSTEALVEHFAAMPRRDGPDPGSLAPGHVLAGLEQDLRNGLALWTKRSAERRSRVVVEDAVADKFEIAGYIGNLGRGVEFHLPKPATGREEAPSVSRSAGFTEPVAENLELALRLGIEAQIVCHPEIDGTETARAARALQVPNQDVLKCLVLTCHPAGSEAGSADDFAAAVVAGTRWVDFERFSRLAGGGPWRLAEPDEVAERTGHTVGGVPVIAVFGRALRVFVDDSVFARDRVWGSAGSEFAGMGFAPEELSKLGAVRGDFCLPESRVSQESEAIRKAMASLEKALERDDDAAAVRAVSRLSRLVGHSP